MRRRSLLALLLAACAPRSASLAGGDLGRFGQECSSQSSCCAAGAEPCPLTCTTLNSKVSYCSAGCETAADCAPFGEGAEELQCMRVVAPCDDDENSTRAAAGRAQRFCTAHSLLWVVGVSMTLMGCLAVTLGTQLQKLAFNRQESAWRVAEAAAEAAAATAGGTVGDGEHLVAAPKPWWQLPMWWAGFVFLVFGSVSDFAALGFAAQSLLAPLAAATLIFNIIQAPCVLGEVPTIFDMLATLVICAGCTVSVSFADHTTRTYSLDEMMLHLQRPLFLGYLGSLLSLMTLAGYRIRCAQRDVRLVLVSVQRCKSPGSAEDHDRMDGQVDENEEEEEEQEEQELDEIERSLQVKSNHFAVILAVLAGQCGGLSMLFAKMLSEIVKTLVQVGGLGAGWLSLSLATLTLLMLMMMVIQLQYLNSGLRMFDLLLIQPIYQASWITGTALNGLLFFQEYLDFSREQWVMVSSISLPITLGVHLSVYVHLCCALSLSL